MLSLGKKTDYKTDYNPLLLFAISRTEKRQQINIDPNSLPFTGYDLWNCYEVTWLNEDGKPKIVLLQLIIPCNSPYLIESKSLKLYLVSFSNTKFSSIESVKNTIKQDLETKLCSKIQVKTFNIKDSYQHPLPILYKAKTLDVLDITCNEYVPNKNLLSIENNQVQEVLYSDLLKSNCPVTNQPDYATIFIQYTGRKINHSGLLKYIVSYRNKTEFHEQCVEQIFIDIKEKCIPEELTIYARYNRRGGIDINPLRTTSLIQNH
ncbi:MAG: NADPH-dependent 7-cyano-7-deazaguanine reductase QueF [Rickettsiales bacterium]|nr:NADPH-dependent 7-cyano-7-deazaguanine reductase QueF [Rickettsiales bacterium]